MSDLSIPQCHCGPAGFAYNSCARGTYSYRNCKVDNTQPEKDIWFKCLIHAPSHKFLMYS